MLKLNRKPDEGFTLVELLIVVAIIGIIAAIAIPNLLSAIQRGKQKRTMGDIKTLASALEAYQTDANAYIGNAGALVATGTTTATPVAAGNLWGGAATNLDPDYQRIPIFKDGWWSSQGATNAAGSGLLMYGAPAAPANDYILCSYGKTGLGAEGPTGAAPQGCVYPNFGGLIGGDGTTFDCDIVMIDGQFNQQPSGKQKNLAGQC